MPKRMLGVNGGNQGFIHRAAERGVEEKAQSVHMRAWTRAETNRHKPRCWSGMVGSSTGKVLIV